MLTNTAGFENSVVLEEQLVPHRHVRLTFLDGLRGLAALTIVLFHASALSWAGGTLPSTVNAFAKLVTYGKFAVPIFIVLSGYCLMLPVARSQDGRLRGGITSYLVRRARRILPPYYITLALTLLLMLVVPNMRQPSGTYWDGALPGFTPEVLLSHIFLVHNLSPDLHFKIDPPMWSVATEWQIYFVFPLILLPVWRRFGTLASVVVGIALGLILRLAFPTVSASASPWFIGLFALGMAGAVLNFSGKPFMVRCRQQVPWAVVNGVLWLLVAVLCVGRSHWWWDNLWFSETLLGIAVTALIVTCTHAALQPEKPKPFLLTLFEARYSVLLGTFSYSLYLVHAPVLALVYFAICAQLPTALLRYGGMLFIATPIAFLVSYGFYLLFERRFTSEAPKPR